MTANKLIKYLEEWAPPGAAWDRDNVGLQVGSREMKLKNIMLCLELNKEVLKEAIQKNCNFIFTHHPFIFNPIKKLELDNDNNAQLLQTIIKNSITVYSAHTNLDFTKDGVSFELAKRLKLKNIDFLQNEVSNQYKVVVFVPKKDLNAVADSVFKAGGGIIGEYSNCSFQLEGVGTFKGSEKSNPVIGQKLNLESVNEIRLEVLVEKWNLGKVISEMIKAHPYEEPAYDIYQTQNNNSNFGYGAIGNLENSINETEFLSYTTKSLKAEAVRFCKGSGRKIKKVAVCGGSGSDLISRAIQLGADTFITADIKYHAFQEAEGKILLIDAGHYETEIFSLSEVESRIKKLIDSKEKISVFRYSKSTNPIKFYKH